MKHMEMEYKWDANFPHAFDRAKKFLKEFCEITTADSLHIHDTYLDNAHGDLSKHRIALRVRNTDGVWEATFKTRTKIQNGKAVRQEETLPLPNVQTRAQALRMLAQQTNWPFLNTQELYVRFTLSNKRTVFLLRYQTSVLELVLDQVTIFAAGHRTHLKEIELELKQGTEKELTQFAQLFTQQTQLKYATLSKVKTAEKLLRRQKK